MLLGFNRMKYKIKSLQDELNQAPLLLRIMLMDADLYCQTHFQKELTITRVLGKIQGDSGVHADYRAADARNELNGSWTFTLEQVDELLAHINKIYLRNDGFDSVIHHSFQGAPFHFHFQIATLTKTYMPKGLKN